MQSSDRVLLGWQATTQEVEAVAEALPDVDVVAVPPHPSLSPYDCAPEAFEEMAKDADSVLAWGINNRVLGRLTNLKLLAWLHSGIDPIDQSVLEANGIALTNVSGANADAVAEHAFALALSLAKRLPERNARVRDSVWVPLWQPGTSAMLLHGATIVVVGIGAIGSRVARIAKAFGMQVLGVRRSGEADEAVDEMFRTDGLISALRRADLVVVAVPLTDATNGLIGHHELEAMPSHSYLVNVCRGHVVDEAAVRAALDTESIAGFASDVWWTYPNHIPEGWHFAVPSRLGVHRHANTVATGDHASDVIAVRDTMIATGIENVRAFLAGETPPNLLFDGRVWHRRP